MDIEMLDDAGAARSSIVALRAALNEIRFDVACPAFFTQQPIGVIEPFGSDEQIDVHVRPQMRSAVQRVRERRTFEKEDVDPGSTEDVEQPAQFALTERIEDRRAAYLR